MIRGRTQFYDPSSLQKLMQATTAQLAWMTLVCYNRSLSKPSKCVYMRKNTKCVFRNEIYAEYIIAYCNMLYITYFSPIHYPTSFEIFHPEYSMTLQYSKSSCKPDYYSACLSEPCVTIDHCQFISLFWIHASIVNILRDVHDETQTKNEVIFQMPTFHM